MRRDAREGRNYQERGALMYRKYSNGETTINADVGTSARLILNRHGFFDVEERAAAERKAASLEKLRDWRARNICPACKRRNDDHDPDCMTG